VFQVSVQRSQPNEEFKITVASDWHAFHKCRPEICWQIRGQARRKTIVMMEKVREAIAFTAELAHESTGCDSHQTKWTLP